MCTCTNTQMHTFSELQIRPTQVLHAEKQICLSVKLCIHQTKMSITHIKSVYTYIHQIQTCFFTLRGATNIYICMHVSKRITHFTQNIIISTYANRTTYQERSCARSVKPSRSKSVSELLGLEAFVHGFFLHISVLTELGL